MRSRSAASDREHGHDVTRDRPCNPDMMGHIEPDNMEVHLVCSKTEQTEPGSPGNEAITTSPKIGEGRNLEQVSRGGVQEKDNQSRNLGPITQQPQQPARAHFAVCTTH